MRDDGSQTQGRWSPNEGDVRPAARQATGVRAASTALASRSTKSFDRRFSNPREQGLVNRPPNQPSASITGNRPAGPVARQVIAIQDRPALATGLPASISSS